MYIHIYMYIHKYNKLVVWDGWRIHPSIRPSVNPFIQSSIHPSIHPPIHPSIHPPTQLSICLSIHPFIVFLNSLKLESCFYKYIGILFTYIIYLFIYHGWMDGSMHACMHAWMDGLMDGGVMSAF